LLEPASKELKARKAPSNLKIKRNSKREKYMKRDIKGISLILPASDQKKKRKQTRRKAKDDRQDICIDLLPKKIIKMMERALLVNCDARNVRLHLNFAIDGAVQVARSY
jgi:hypothetical protein